MKTFIERIKYRYCYEYELLLYITDVINIESKGLSIIDWIFYYYSLHSRTLCFFSYFLLWIFLIVVQFVSTHSWSTIHQFQEWFQELFIIRNHCVVFIIINMLLDSTSMSLKSAGRVSSFSFSSSSSEDRSIASGSWVGGDRRTVDRMVVSGYWKNCWDFEEK